MNERVQQFLRVCLVFGALSLAAPVSAQPRIPPGAFVEDGLQLDITNRMAVELGPLIPWLMGDSVPSPALSTEVDCPVDCGSTVTLDLSASSLSLELLGSEMWTTPGELHLSQTVLIGLADPTAPATLSVGDGSGRACTAGDVCCDYDACPVDSCEVWSTPVPVRIDMSAAFSVTDPDGPGGNPPDFQVTFTTEDHNAAEALSDSLLDGSCASGADPRTLLGAGLGTALLDLFEPTVVRLVEQDVPGFLEANLPAILTFLDLQESFDVLGAPLDLRFTVSDLVVSGAGLRLAADVLTDTAATHECVAAFDPGGSLFTDNPAPGQTAFIPGDGRRHHAGVLLSDDMVNQLLYTLWRAGLLCQAVDESLLPFSLDTEFLGLLLGDRVAAALADMQVDGGPAPVLVRTVPTAVPTVDFTSPADLRVWLRDFDLQFYSEVLGRQALLFTARVDLALDLDIGFTEFGEVRLSVGVHGADANPRIVEPGLLPRVSAALAHEMPAFLDTVVDVAGGALLGDMFLGPIVFSGLGMTDGKVAAMGEQSDFAELFALAGAPMDGASEGGLDCASDCEALSCLDPAACEGCDHAPGAHDGRVSAGPALLLLPLAVLFAARIRRR